LLPLAPPSRQAAQNSLPLTVTELTLKNKVTRRPVVGAVGLTPGFFYDPEPKNGLSEMAALSTFINQYMIGVLGQRIQCEPKP
jgi:hypothetical protein